MPKFTSADHNGAAQLDSALEQFRVAALKSNRPWTLDIETIDGTLMLSGTVAPGEPLVIDEEDTLLLDKNA